MCKIQQVSGINLSISEADVRHAESVGDIKKRDAVQTDDVIAALQHTTLADAKAAGRRRRRAGMPTGPRKAILHKFLNDLGGPGRLCSSQLLHG